MSADTRMDGVAGEIVPSDRIVITLVDAASPENDMKGTKGATAVVTITKLTSKVVNLLISIHIPLFEVEPGRILSHTVITLGNINGVWKELTRPTWNDGQFSLHGLEWLRLR